MNVRDFKVQKQEKLSKAILDGGLDLSYNEVKKIIRNKDVKVNGKRVSSDLALNVGDQVTLYYNSRERNPALIIYEDDNIVIASKPRGIESVNTTGDGFLELLSDQLNLSGKLKAVHRLDRNTTGLIVFAKNEEAKASLDKAFKSRTIDKFYLALVVGKPKKEEHTLVGYLKKIADESRVLISDFPQNQYEKIETKYKKLKSNENLSLLEVELLTGKTHQIRAHLSHIGCPILGDSKYGNLGVNREFGVKYQCLCSYKIIFHFAAGDFLSYLDKREFVLDNLQIDFLKFI